MFWKILLFCALGQLASIKSQDTDLTSTSVEQKIQEDVFKLLTAQTKTFWKVTPADQNIQFPPFSLEVTLQMLQMKVYYESVLAAFNSKTKYLEKSYALAGILDKLQQTSNAKLKFINAIFYDQGTTSKQLLNELKTYYHAEAYETSFDSNAGILALVNEWMSKHTKGRSPKIDKFPTTGMTNLQSSLISYTSCWDTPKNWANFIKVLKFKNSNGESDIETFNAKETIGYYNNAEQKYEAIRLPYTKGEFAMIVVLPHQDQTLESLSKFTETDHKQILQRVSENYENIDYAIPFMNLTQMSVNENGTSINGDDTIVCDWSSAHQENHETDINKIDYRAFYVDRPFGVYIYHEKTKFVIMYALVNNPALGTMKFRTFLAKLTSTNEKIDFQFNR